MTPIRRVVFLDQKGQPIRAAPSRLTPVEREAQGPPQDGLVEFGESRAPAPRQASVHHTILPAPVGAAQELVRIRKSNAIREQPRRVRRRRARAARRVKRTASPAARRTARSRPVRRTTRRSKTTSRTTTQAARGARKAGVRRTTTRRTTRRSTTTTVRRVRKR